jgi:hypothetical protein
VTFLCRLHTISSFFVLTRSRAFYTRTSDGSRNQYGGQQAYQQQTYNQGGYANQAYSGYSNPAQQPQSYNQQYGMPQQQYYGAQPMYQQQPYQAAQPAYGAVAAPAASPWRTATSADGQMYYYNSLTNETSWDKPPGMP